MIKNIWTAGRDWLSQVPVEDPVDRRNAPFVQLLLMGMGLVVPVNKVIHLCFTSFRHSMSGTGLLADVFTDGVMMAVAWWSFYLVRTGRFRQGVTLYLAVMLLSALLAYSLIGLERLTNDPFPLLLLGVGGLVMGRRTLWRVYAVLMLVFLAGSASDVLRQLGHGPVEWFLGKKVSMVASYTIVAIILDRTIAALRESLAESNARGQLLAVANESLYREMQDRVRAQQLLVHAQKLETVGRVAGGVAHDFSNLLGVILGYAQRRERLADSGVDALLGALQGVEGAAQRGMTITRRLLSFSRQEPTRLEVFDVADALRDLLPMVCQLFDTNVRVELALSESPLPIRFDRSQFELVVLSMAANARDAMPQGGRFLIGTHGDEALGSVEVTLADSGLGMSEEVSGRVFDAFFTTKAADRGTGLGLSVVKDVVTAASGRIDVRSAPGQGSSFRISLPRAAAAQPMELIA